MPRIEAIDGPDDSAARQRWQPTHTASSAVNRLGQGGVSCGVLAGAATLNETGHGCPARYDEAFAGSFGWSSPARNDMRCRPDGRHRLSGTTHVIVGDFNRSSAFGVDRPTCASFRFGRAKAAKQPRQTHRGPALLGADRDLGKVLSAGRAGRFSLMNMGMNYSRQKLDGLWTPCTNVAFIMCALRGWLPGRAACHSYIWPHRVAASCAAVGRAESAGRSSSGTSATSCAASIACSTATAPTGTRSGRTHPATGRARHARRGASMESSALGCGGLPRPVAAAGDQPPLELPTPHGQRRLARRPPPPPPACCMHEAIATVRAHRSWSLLVHSCTALT